MVKKSKPKAVLIADIHYTINTLELASASLRAAMLKASELRVPFIIAGDTLDSKAIIRAECANRLMEDLNSSPYIPEHMRYILVGNHDLINEKAHETSLEFLRTHCNLITAPSWSKHLDMALIPYQPSQDELKAFLSTLSPGSTIVAHQGLKTAYMGHYVQDTSSIDPEHFDTFRVFSGHYHRRQQIKCGKSGAFSYIGNPYSLSFSECEDGPKGIQILYDDGSLEFIELSLPRHIKISCKYEDLNTMEVKYNPGDNIWLRVTGVKSQLNDVRKKELGIKLFNTENYRLELIEIEQEARSDEQTQLSEPQLLDSLIDQTKDTLEHRNYLKSLYRELLNENS